MSSVHKARKEFAWLDSIMLECCTRLQAYNRRVKEYVAIYDCQAANEAMNGGFMGLGCNDNKLIASICTRSKKQLQRTKRRFRELYDKDLVEEVRRETSGGYRELLTFILASSEAYIADVVDVACHAGVLELGCDEIALLEVFVTHTQVELQAGKCVHVTRTCGKPPPPAGC